MTITKNAGRVVVSIEGGPQLIDLTEDEAAQLAATLNTYFAKEFRASLVIQKDILIDTSKV